jgi:lysozyme family protein
MQTVEQIAEAIIRREGGFVNDTDDPGGATNFGVTVHTMRRLGLDLDADGDVDISDVRLMDKDRAREIFLKNYFYEPKLDRLPRPLQPSVFDMYVNAGAQAVKLLQSLFNDMGFGVAVDGKLGPQTVKAARNAMLMAPEHLVDAYGIARRNYYYRLADRRPASRKYARTTKGNKGGWIKRAEEFISARYHFSERDHRNRIKAWV